MNRFKHPVDSSTGYRQQVAFRGIDGLELARQYALRREMGAYRQNTQGNHISALQDDGDAGALQIRLDERRNLISDSNHGGLMERLAVWLSKVGAT